MYNFGVIFGIFRHFIPEQIAAAKVKKNRRNLRKSWLEITHAYRVENPTEFVALGRICEIFLKDWKFIS